MQNLITFYLFLHKILSGNEILTISKGHNCVVNLRKLTYNNPNLDLLKVNAYAIFDQIPLICSHYIERKQNTLKYRETLYGRHTTLTPVVVKTDSNGNEGIALES